MIAQRPTPRRVLVISHSGEATGAAIALERIMRWCVERGALCPTFVLRSGGELLDDFRRLGSTFVLSQKAEIRLASAREWLPGGAAMDALGRLAAARWLQTLCRRNRIELVYANTATQPQLVSAVAGMPAITHVHELRGMVEETVGAGGLRHVIGQSDLLLAASRKVRQMLIEAGAAPARVIEVQEPVAELPQLSDESRRRLRREVLHAPDDAVVVAACGRPSWRKGTDVFLRVAQELLSDRDHVVFRWIGGPETRALYTLLSDAERLGLTPAVAATGQTPSGPSLMAAVDVLLSTSREDPNPLVVLEAAVAGTPVICFEEAGGAAELAQLGGAVAVPYLNAGAMAEALRSLIDDPDRRRHLGDRARRIVQERNAVSVVGPQVLSAVEQVASGRH